MPGSDPAPEQRSFQKGFHAHTHTESGFAIRLLLVVVGLAAQVGRGTWRQRGAALTIGSTVPYNVMEGSAGERSPTTQTRPGPLTRQGAAGVRLVA